MIYIVSIENCKVHWSQQQDKASYKSLLKSFILIRLCQFILKDHFSHHRDILYMIIQKS